MPQASCLVDIQIQPCRKQSHAEKKYPCCLLRLFTSCYIKHLEIIVFPVDVTQGCHCNLRIAILGTRFFIAIIM